MPYTLDPSTPTPESLLPRSDSKNPSITCAGITSSGRPCRRPLASPASSPAGARRASAPPNTHDAANAYCWQHRDQAPISSPRPLPPAQIPVAHASKPHRRTSTDDLLGKFDGLDLASSVGGPRPSRPRPQARPSRKRRPGFWESLCCMTGSGSADDDYLEVVRHKKRTSERPQQTAVQPAMTQTSYPVSSAPIRPGMHHMPASAPAAPSATHTQSYMRYMSPSLDPKTTATLLAEMCKPISTGDEEGYIYIFWLTPESKRDFKPSDDDAESLLQPPTPRPKGNRQASARKEELLRANSIVRRPISSTRGVGDAVGPERRIILLKIGRANNVHRRMAEWTRQCGYDLSLVRFYPYVAASQLQSQQSLTPRGQPSLSPRCNDGVRKVPCVHRVERLIHLELAGQRKKQEECETCGREHREWFEVEASKSGVRAVDAVVRKWVGWAEEEARLRGE